MKRSDELSTQARKYIRNLDGADARKILLEIMEWMSALGADADIQFWGGEPEYEDEESVEPGLYWSSCGLKLGQ